MKILSSSEIKQADTYTIEHEPVASIDLMERAASACFDWINSHFDKAHSFKIFCGTGNNGGDGLAIARMMSQADYNVETYVIRYSDRNAEDFLLNEKRLKELNPNAVLDIHDERSLPPIQKTDIVIDAIFGTGLSKPAEGLAAATIRHINRSGATVVSVDIPSGLFADVATDHNDAIITAKHTLTFGAPKLAFMFAENYQYVGEWEILDIGLHKKFIEEIPAKYFLVDREEIKGILKPRGKFSHKGNFGHALLVAGSYGKIGAAVLAAKACLRSGAGLLTVHVPKCGYQVLQSTVPEAMVETDEDENIFTSAIATEKFSAAGIGCGIGTEEKTVAAFRKLLSSIKTPLVIDADAINILGLDKKFLSRIPENSILTPHVKEFERITEKAKNDFHRHALQISFAQKYKVVVVLKGAHTCMALPDGTAYFNNTGNPGMAKGGSGDALIGIILSLLAQGYSSSHAALLGVYVHGLAGDIAAGKMSEQSMIASDLIAGLGDAFLEISSI